MKILNTATLALLALSIPAAFAEEHSAEEYHRHHVAALVLGSHSGEKNGFTVGGDYEFRFARPIGVTVTGEYVGGGFREDLVAFTATVHPWKGLKLQAGPGFDHELRRHETEAAEGESAAHQKVNRALFRVGGGYDIEVGKNMTIGPDFAYDILKGERVVVYGVTIGFGFGRR